MKRFDVVLLVLLMALWGLNFSVIKLGVNNIDPLVLTAMRFFFAVIPLVFFIKKPDVKWRYLIMYGVSFGVGVWGMTTLSIDAGLSSGMASLLLDMSVVSGLFVGWYFLDEKITSSNLIGAFLALSGLVLILQLEDGSITIEGVGLVLIASLFWSVNGLIVKKANTQSIFAFNIWAMLFAPVLLLLLAVISHGVEAITLLPQHLNQLAIISALFQAYPTTLLGYWFWNKMIMKYSISRVAPMTLLVPVFGIFGGVVFYNEAIEPTHIIATVLILLGLLIGRMAFFEKVSHRLFLKNKDL
ncbi:EamA family transporter [Marinomonas sp. 15G1-11]|uniref:EamA family transporter n=1 Tax=Marinomonas phaeophyticola TaxID=3004091 RepID=A0ABT4JYJ8_9GAMM|nr:EamA family transporter [Marinomonas sp. 15G1-11]MCZ2723472.1 EamA family transporter [Marinomonas sp. 15G1-11]